MVAKDPESNETESRFLIRPNRSFSWRATKWFFAGACLVYACIAGLFLFVGAWPVLPFTGLEVLALGGALYLSALQGKACEIVRVAGETVEVHAGTTEHMRCYRFPRAWTRLVVRGGLSARHPSRLMLGARGTVLELGHFLAEEERLQLARELRQALGASPWRRW